MAKVALKLGDDISTDIIYPGRYMATVLPTETPQYAFVDDAEFNKKLKAKQVEPGSFIVAGKNFGCGSSREQAASCLTGWGLKVIAKNFARIFLQNSINVGLYMVICPAIEADEGDEIEIIASTPLGNPKVKNVTKGKEFDTVPLPKARQAIIDAGGLIPYTRKLILSGRK
ncbi:MAG TPA: 3-isopropylmalate dehydratase [candidate division Zixibacteria bacterium]|jgi:3-isopropylmalate/(R)-2-methylmalate dehydratase small subunit|nr:3-isopropylmalate dehydratase [candidate division Zixibacteria bacterium]